MNSVSVTSKGQVTIPKEIRQKLGIRAGSRVEMRLVGDHAELVVVSHTAEVTSSGFGMLRSRRESVPADFDVATLASGE
jgi:antitoxin PrlF